MSYSKLSANVYRDHSNPAYVRAYRERLAANKAADDANREKLTIKPWMFN